MYNIEWLVNPIVEALDVALDAALDVASGKQNTGVVCVALTDAVAVRWQSVVRL